MENLRFYVIYITILATIVGLFYYNKLPNKKAKSLLVLIFLSFLAEFVGKFFYPWFGVKNYIVFNLYWLITFNGYVLLLSALLKKIINKRISNCFLLLINIFFIVNMIYLEDIFTQVLSYFFALGAVFTLILSSLYFVEIINSSKVLHYKKSIYFWFILGVLLFYIPFLPFMLASKMFLFNDLGAMFSVVLFVLNLLMYGSFIVGFIWSQKKYNY
ncbi:MAG: hypothetical protein V4648_05015 [Bacteroidota bacterium]